MIQKLHMKDVEDIHNMMEEKGYTGHLYGFILGADIVDGNFPSYVVGVSTLWYRSSIDSEVVEIPLTLFNADNIPTIITNNI